MTHASHHLTLADIARHLDVDFEGDADQPIRGLATLKEAAPDQVAFLANRAYLKDLATTKAAGVLLHPEHGKNCPVPRLEMDNPYLGYAKLSQLFDPLPARDVPGIHPSAVVAEGVTLGAEVCVQANAVIESGVVLGDRVVVGAGSVIGADCVIGDDTRLHANVTVCHGVVVGKRVILHSGCVIGGDGFGFAHDGAGWHKIAQLGGVVLGDDVEVGSCSSIDRGALGDTVIGNDVKIDSQVQIAHNVTIGDHSALAGCVGIAGSTKVGKHCMLGGGVGLSGHLTICDGVQVTGMSLVTNSIHEPGVYSSGTGAMSNTQWRKNAVRFKQLDDIAKRLARVEKSQRES
ncbi:MAG: UDP-3-O-(3-hydroxymyristoyl)glucosamine N-acyltransferase [Pseudomonadota bacterium]|mgnify:FL=1|jgi:UDP-3-O-[3-hydroxymyristoyl] glucosamine N-acyltransferase|uniref:UDP-3-O-acylglucosamine N-acyltransferase n=1 Tax=Vreelandella aquamarina TaxID=77097 RepID=A0A1H8L0Z7_9GAMM|nr:MULTISPECIES: UDP-3-O-(3-hydroxymyristoyl)glucosamine N-acyltransferase [Halomonas]MEC8936121.1 UDP-3-O-(3-hydroxymyristoyl)glucosamine N-acyltransferase [Pseudomonadota bacterium]MCP1303334.1 UDP-3-O-(3-hydroxymyristoyl)glucosamine N-acyltransferase [Halomonas sp. R1t8]MCP1329317.1 UDP-3-O-(3-hydroxymyristoyl)glucosamine N-acyltransferase [Halomonas sp. R1t4]SEN98769.1 UDP-3-O-[3-hydroxymyristoyl] glucosamine N-acyltransferase [Halomonas aquamarina]BCB72699.1 UDP-3-O-acylglucosamine N-acyl|tara:strand:+ start:3813 stop:4850 length:1038 start_codon:yes stop_codon:yes gene_type:complete